MTHLNIGTSNDRPFRLPTATLTQTTAVLAEGPLFRQVQHQRRGPKPQPVVPNLRHIAGICRKADLRNVAAMLEQLARDLDRGAICVTEGAKR